MASSFYAPISAEGHSKLVMHSLCSVRHSCMHYSFLYGLGWSDTSWPWDGQQRKHAVIPSMDRTLL
ncbi:hypothetical protein SCLCIDRAFT_1221625 [Scleroderma citrinum Foug A]|uniref:Uncharacterized protein n=1 Tax=Scleroderma citrinum Foug A TaxID=1036808 RepID=A0A0C2ZQC7_9AGAM|nr:hypothetical protein SCLCIDRAFT_1221625 [Scleroderma citrinum Foug A]